MDRQWVAEYYTEVGASTLINDRRFRQLDVVVENADEIKMNKRSVTNALPLHRGFFIILYAKLHILQFYYDFMDSCLE